jgi:iron complex outermembrane receptor protein
LYAHQIRLASQAAARKAILFRTLAESLAVGIPWLTANISSVNPACSAALSNFGPGLIGVPASLQGLICIPNLDPRYDGGYSDEGSEGKWSGIAAATYRFAENISAYAQYSRGYKGGGYQLGRSGMNPLSPSLSQNAFGAETADSYEAGLRGFSADGVWRASAALFYTALNEYQFSYFTGLNRRTQNVPELVSKGFEVEVGVRPIPSLELTLATAYQETIFGKSGFPAALVNVQGTTAPLAPRWVVVGAATFARNLESYGLRLFASVNLRRQSRANVEASAMPSPNFDQNAYAVVGARMGISGIDDSWTLELWGRNIFDNRAWSVLNSTTLQPGSISGNVTDPQLLGLGGTIRW